MPKVLIADDESHILNVVTLKLRNAGYEVVTACDGEEAYDKVIAEAPEIFVTDFHMPVMTGVDVCRKLRAEAGFYGPAILLTARGGEIEPSVLDDAGIVAVLTKPFSPRQLLSTVNATLATA